MTLKNFFNNHGTYRAKLALTFILITQTFVLLLIAEQKQGYFIDEIYSYGLSNSYNKPFLSSYDLYDHWIDGKKLWHDYVTVQTGERFTYDSVYYNQTMDVHPPLYYFLLHSVSSFFPEAFSKWMGLFINFFIFIICGILIFKIGTELFKIKGLALLPVIFWGFNPSGINNALFIRMYMLLTLFTLINAYLHIRITRQWKSSLLIGIAITCMAGFLTQYYFAVYAFFTALFFFVYKLWQFKANQSPKQLLIYAGTMIGAFGLSVALYPAVLNHVLFGDNQMTAQTHNNIGSLSGYFSLTFRYAFSIASEIFSSGKIAVVIFTMLTISLIIIGIYCRKKYGSIFRFVKCLKNFLNADDRIILAMLAITVLTFLVIAKIAVYTAPRYLYNLFPFFMIILVWYLYKLECIFKNKLVYINVSLLFIFIFLFSLYSGRINYLYKENAGKLEMLGHYSNMYCLYLQEKNTSASMTADLLEMTIYKSIYTTPSANIGKFHEIFNGKNISAGIIVYIDTHLEYDAEEEINKVKEISGFKNIKLISENGLSTQYYLY